MGSDLLFVYGTLRAGFDGPMARRLVAEARHVGPASVAGVLLRVADYPGFVPGDAGRVTGDLLALDDADATLAWLDDYEQCAPHWPPPHEYRRDRRMVEGPDGPVDAWVYIYARPVAGLPVIAGGDFLRDGAGGR